MAVGRQCTTLVRGEGDLKTEKIKFMGDGGGWVGGTMTHGTGQTVKIDSNQQYTYL